MTAKGDAIAHGATMMNYTVNKDKAQIVLVNGLPGNIEPLAMWSRMMQHQHQMMKDRYSPRPLKNNALRFEISPTKEQSEGWTLDDWRNLAGEFIRTLDGIEQLPSRQKTKFKRTNISQSQYAVTLHTDSKSGIPHLHLVANRVDGMGNTNDAHFIGQRAVHAAYLINARRSWKQAEEYREDNIRKITDACYSALRSMPSFDWEMYGRKLIYYGYGFELKRDSNGIVRGYTVSKGNSHYKSSLLGNSRNLMPSKIGNTWAMLRKEKQEEENTKRLTKPRIEKPSIIERARQRMAEEKAQAARQEPRNENRFLFSFEGSSYDITISESAKQVFDEELTPTSNASMEDLTKVAVLLFAEYVDAVTAMSESCGGGGSPGTGWGRDKDEDDREWARRCAQKANWLFKPVRRSRGR